MTLNSQNAIAAELTDAVYFDSMRQSIQSWIATLTDSETKLKQHCIEVLSNLGQSHSQDDRTRESMLTLQQECDAAMARVAGRAEYEIVAAMRKSECEFLRMQNAELSEKLQDQAKLQSDYEILKEENQELVAQLRTGTTLAAKLLAETGAGGTSARDAKLLAETGTGGTSAREIAELREQCQKLLEKIDAEKARNDHLASRSKTVHRALESLKTDLQRLEDEEKNAHAEKNKLMEENVKLSNQYKSLKTMWSAVGQRVEELRAHVAEEHGDLDELPLEAQLGDAQSTFANPMPGTAPSIQKASPEADQPQQMVSVMAGPFESLASSETPSTPSDQVSHVSETPSILSSSSQESAQRNDSASPGIMPSSPPKKKRQRTDPSPVMTSEDDQDTPYSHSVPVVATMPDGRGVFTCQKPGCTKVRAIYEHPAPNKS
ncbi:hypothetical protein HK104_001399 [Borealophlyctis nickersoniae]|nr:hypothetical protein HK104_001399 [Borealophlyctis nickersoniae]